LLCCGIAALWLCGCAAVRLPLLLCPLRCPLDICPLGGRGRVGARVGGARWVRGRMESEWNGRREERGVGWADI
jgi:hypothetical protein